MGGTDAYGGDCKEDVLARVKGPGACRSDVYTDSVARKSFDSCFGAPVTNVAVDELEQSEETLESPADDDHFEVLL